MVDGAGQVVRRDDQNRKNAAEAICKGSGRWNWVFAQLLSNEPTIWCELS